MEAGGPEGASSGPARTACLIPISTALATVRSVLHELCGTGRTTNPSLSESSALASCAARTTCVSSGSPLILALLCQAEGIACARLGCSMTLELTERPARAVCGPRSKTPLSPLLLLVRSPVEHVYSGLPPSLEADSLRSSLTVATQPLLVPHVPPISLPRRHRRSWGSARSR